MLALCRFMTQDREQIQDQLQTKQREIESEIANLVKKRKVSVFSAS